MRALAKYGLPARKRKYLVSTIGEWQDNADLLRWSEKFKCNRLINFLFSPWQERGFTSDIISIQRGVLRNSVLTYCNSWKKEYEIKQVVEALKAGSIPVVSKLGPVSEYFDTWLPPVLLVDTERKFEDILNAPIRELEEIQSVCWAHWQRFLKRRRSNGCTYTIGTIEENESAAAGKRRCCNRGESCGHCNNQD